MMSSEDQDIISNKKQNSYTYWVKNDPNQVKMDCTPQKIEHPLVQENNNVNGHSQWNQSGTWEEKNLKAEDVQKVLEQSLSAPLSLGNNIVVLSVSKVEGESAIYLSRGKKRLGYHLKLNFDFEGLNHFESYNGQIQYTEFADDGDRDYHLKSDSKSNELRKEIQAHIEKLNTHILSALNVFKQ